MERGWLRSLQEASSTAVGLDNPGNQFHSCRFDGTALAEHGVHGTCGTCAKNCIKSCIDVTQAAGLDNAFSPSYLKIEVFLFPFEFDSVESKYSDMFGAKMERLLRS